MNVNYHSKQWALIYDQFNQGRYQKELAFYRAELKQCAGPVLEVACGNEMIFLELLQEGFDIYGFDISQEMLGSLFGKADALGQQEVRARVSRQNMVDFSYDLKFGGIYIPARSFLHLLSQEEQIQCLRNIHHHLQEGGKFLLNFFNPSLHYLLANAGPAEQFEFIKGFTNPETGESVRLLCKQENDVVRQEQRILWRFSEGDRTHDVPMKLRWIYKEEFQLLLQLAGFKKWKVYGDFDRSEEVTAGSELIWVAERT